MTGRQRTTIAAAFLAVAAVAAPLGAQAPTPADTTEGPTPAQQRYLDGLRSTGRGVAQLKSGIGIVQRHRGDSAQLTTAARRLGGLCGSARSFMRQGRAKMAHTAYQDSVRVIARRLNTRIDSVLEFLPTCQRQAASKPAETSAELISLLRSYEAVLQAFREAVILPQAAAAAPGSDR